MAKFGSIEPNFCQCAGDKGDTKKSFALDPRTGWWVHGGVHGECGLPTEKWWRGFVKETRKKLKADDGE